MLRLEEALALLLDTVRPFEPQSLPLDECWQLTLAEDIVSTTDSPPFDKSLMDGYAVRSEDVASGQGTLRVVERIFAGQVPQKALEPGTAIQIMTGAPLPTSCDAVVKVEETSEVADVVTIDGKPVSPGQNLIRRGTSLKVGETVLRAGQNLTAARIGTLAELGMGHVRVRRRPRISVLATGDELVPVEATPGPGQIRNSNQAMLVAQIRSCGAIPAPLGIARDNRADLDQKIELGQQSDILVLSGGVSAGQADLVPQALKHAGVHEVFHKVDMKPGKPVWFGEFRRPDGEQGYVFGLPGNPVSSLVCFELFVRTAVRRLMGVLPEIVPSVPARLEADFQHRSDRPTYHPAELTWGGQGAIVRLMTWHGSSDLRGTAQANAMAIIPAGARSYRAGDILEVVSWS